MNSNCSDLLDMRNLQEQVKGAFLYQLFLHVSKSKFFFFNLNSNFSYLLDLRNLQEQVKKAFCYQKLFRPFTFRTNCSSDLKIFANSRLSASNFKSFSWSLEQFFLTVGRNNFGNKIPFHSANEDKIRAPDALRDALLKKVVNIFYIVM